MFPTLYEIQTSSGPLGLHTYGLFILAAFCSAFIYVHLRAQKIGLHPDRLIAIYVAAAIGGIAGGRLLYAIAVDWERTIANPLTLFQPAGFAVYGGVIGGTIAVAIVAVVGGIRPWKLADIAAPSVIIGMGVGRLGCLSAGCCHGAVIDGYHPQHGLLPSSFDGGQFWLSSDAPFLATEFASGNGGVSRLTDVPLYPTQTWAAVSLLALAAFLAWLWNRRRFDGQIAALTLMLEPIFRISIEAFRADHRGYAFAWEVSAEVAEMLPAGMTQAGETLGSSMVGLTTSQAIGLGSIFAGLVIYLLRMRSGVAPETKLPDEEHDDDDLDDALLDIV